MNRRNAAKNSKNAAIKGRLRPRIAEMEETKRSRNAINSAARRERRERARPAGARRSRTQPAARNQRQNSQKQYH
eukprot:3071745-Rhodomonas_salina.1